MHEAKDGVSAVHLFWILLFQVSFCWAHSSNAIYICLIGNKLCSGFGQFENYHPLVRSVERWENKWFPMTHWVNYPSIYSEYTEAPRIHSLVQSNIVLEGALECMRESFKPSSLSTLHCKSEHR